MTTCARDGCTNEFEQRPIGRPRMYCSNTCSHYVRNHKPKAVATRNAYQRRARTEGKSPREQLRAKLADPINPPFPGAVPMKCSVCERHISWTTPPLPSVPVRCPEHGAPGTLVAVPR
jgi:hypothetical protein